MVGLARFETEKYLLEMLERISRNRSGYRVLYVNVSKLKPKNRHPRFVKIIAKLFDDLVAIANGSMFVLSNGDFAIVGKNITEKTVAEAVDKLRRGLVTDPIWTAHSSSEFTKLYEPEEFEDLVKRIEELLLMSKPVDLLAYRYPVDASQIDGLKDRLDEINIVEIIKHQSVLKLEKMGNLTPMFEEFFVAVKDLSKKFDPNVDLTGNKWLFLYLSQTLDKKTMYSFLFSDIKNKPQKVSLNLNLSTMFLPEFEDFVKRIEEDGQKIVVEVQVMDILNNLAAYFDAKELLHQEGHQILIDAASIEMLQALNVKKLEPDYIKIFWHTLMEEYEGNALGVKQMLEDIGVDKIILAKCLDEKALRWGIKNGIRAFQGPYMDLAEVALIKSKCPNGKVCTTEECLQRRKLIAGAFRDQCLHKDFLEKETN